MWKQTKPEQDTSDTIQIYNTSIREVIITMIYFTLYMLSCILSGSYGLNCRDASFLSSSAILCFKTPKGTVQMSTSALHLSPLARTTSPFLHLVESHQLASSALHCPYFLVYIIFKPTVPCCRFELGLLVN